MPITQDRMLHLISAGELLTESMDRILGEALKTRKKLIDADALNNLTIPLAYEYLADLIATIQIYRTQESRAREILIEEKTRFQVNARSNTRAREALRASRARLKIQETPTADSNPTTEIPTLNYDLADLKAALRDGFAENPNGDNHLDGRQILSIFESALGLFDYEIGGKLLDSLIARKILIPHAGGTVTLAPDTSGAPDAPDQTQNRP